MQVYIEYVIIDNLAIDAVIVYLSLKSAKLPARWYSVLLSAALGTAAAVAMPFASAWPAPALIAAKCACSLAIVAVAAKYPGWKKYLFTLMLFYVYTFLLGGICMGAMYFLGADIVSMATLTYRYPWPVGLLAGGVFLLYLLSKSLLEYLQRRRLVDSLVDDVELVCGERRVRARGFLDTGNRLYDDQTGFPVVIVSRDFAERLAGIPPGGEFSALKKLHTAPFRTVRGDGQLLLFRPDRLLVYRGKDVHTIEDVMVGVSDNAPLFGEDCEVLLHGSMILAEEQHSKRR